MDVFCSLTSFPRLAHEQAANASPLALRALEGQDLAHADLLVATELAAFDAAIPIHPAHGAAQALQEAGGGVHTSQALPRPRG